MSGELNKPRSTSTPGRITRHSRSSSTSSQRDLFVGWSTDYEGTELISETEHSQCFSVTSADSNFNRELYHNFDQTLTTCSNTTSDSDCEYLAAESAIENSDVFEDITDSADSRPDSVVSVIAMPAQTNKEKFLRAFRSCIMIWEDDYEGSDASDELPEDLKDFITRLSAFNTTLHEVVLHFDECPAAEFGDSERAKVSELRDKCSTLKKLAKKRLVDHANAAAAAAAASAAAAAAASTANTSSASDIAAADVAKLTIQTLEPTVMAGVDAVIKEYLELLVIEPKTTGEYKRLAGRAENVAADREKAGKQLIGLKSEAVAACDTDAAERYVLKLKEMNSL